MERIGCPSFIFKIVSSEETVKEVSELSIEKASQALDILVKKLRKIMI